MNYSLNLITLPGDADSLIQTAQRDRRNLAHRKESFQIRTVNSAEDIAEQSVDLAAAKASLQTTDELLKVSPEGKQKEELITKKMELELKIRKLTTGGNKLSAVAIIEQEYDAEQLNKQLEGIDAFIAALTAHKAKL